MSSKRHPPDDEGPSQQDSSRDQTELTKFSEVREVVLLRDRYCCTNCKKPKDQAEALDIDHIVPRGSGGSDRISNLHTLCRKCHDAKENDTAATSVEWMSTGRMDSYEFSWFRHVMNEMLPAIARQLGIRLSPKFKVENKEIWELSVGDLCALDRALVDEDSRYESFD